ncbi:MAG: DUF177 domain-containing protein [Verrucomicrobiota bacterium]
MRINLGELSEDQILTYEGDLRSEDYDLPSTFRWGSIHYDLQIQKLGNECLVRGKVTTEATNLCDRCLEDLEMPVEAQMTQSYQLQGKRAIDLTQQIHEDILLNLPMAFRCQLDTENRCPVTGKTVDATPNDFQDLRRQETWQALENLEKED